MRRTDWPKVKKMYGDFIFYMVTIMKKKKNHLKLATLTSLFSIKMSREENKQVWGKAELSFHGKTRVTVFYESCLHEMCKRVWFHGRPVSSIYITLGSMHKQVSHFRALLMKLLLNRQFDCFPSKLKREQFYVLRFALQGGTWCFTKLWLILYSY